MPTVPITQVPNLPSERGLLSEAPSKTSMAMASAELTAAKGRTRPQEPSGTKSRKARPLAPERG